MRISKELVPGVSPMVFSDPSDKRSRRRKRSERIHCERLVEAEG